MTNSSSNHFGLLPGLLLAAFLPLSAASKGTLVIGHVTTLTGPEAYHG